MSKSLVNIKFMDPKEVGKQNQNMLMSKQKFLVQVHHMKAKGRSNILSTRLENWLEKDYDELYERITHRGKTQALPDQKIIKNNTIVTKKYSKAQERKLIIGAFMNHVDNLLKAKKNQKRALKLDTLKKKAKPQLQYEQRQNFVETQISKTLKFFGKGKQEQGDELQKGI